MTKLRSVLIVLSALAWSLEAAIYKESGGIVVIEAEHFDSRAAAADDHHWHIVPDDDGVDTLADFGDPPFANARGDKYIQTLPDSAGGGQNKNQPGDVGTPPSVDYKVQITTPGTYQLYLRWGGYDGSSDSMYGEIVELRDGTAGSVNDWYRYARALAGNDFAASGWHGVGGPELQNASGGDIPAAWDIPSAGTYTIRLTPREDGCAVDAIALQLTTLPAPGTPGPAESGIATSFITITTQPADVSVATGQTATLTVAATGSSNPSIQWQRAPSGSTTFVDVAGATSASLTTAALTAADSGTQYRAALSIAGLTIHSRAAIVTVDVTPPILYRAVGSATFDQVTLVFSEPLASSATNAANYTIPGLTISGATQTADGETIVLKTSAQTAGQVYTVTAKDIRDLVTPPNTVDPNPTRVEFTAWMLSAGGALHKYWENVTPNNLDALKNDPRFPDEPSFSTIEPAFEYPRNGGNEGGSNYGNQLSALLVPPTTGNYVFFVCSDDPSELYLSTDENPANKKLIATENQWSNARQWVSSGGSSDLDAKRSDLFFGSEWPTPNAINLTAGRRYYIEAIHTEGGGGDNVGVTWQLPGAAEPVNGAPPIPGANLMTYLNPDVSTATIAISSPADGATFPAGGNVSISVNPTDPKGPIRKVEFFTDGKKIGESTAAPFGFTWSGVPAGRYTLSATVLDRQGFLVDSAPVRVVVGNPPPEVLLVIGTDSVPTLNAADAAVKARLEQSGFVVRVKDAPSSATSDADGKVLIVASSTINSGDLGDKMRNVTVPVINWEQALQDNFGMTGNTDGTDRGTMGGLTDVEILTPAHPLAAGLSGTVNIVPDVDTFSWGLPVDSAIKIAQVPGDPSRYLIYAYEAGATAFNGFVIPARRVMLPFGNPTFATVTPDGLKLFDAAVTWAANLPTNAPAAQLSLPVRQGNNLSISWTGAGTLQQADAITGPWTDAPSQSNPQTVPIAGTSRFYRIRQ